MKRGKKFRWFVARFLFKQCHSSGSEELEAAHYGTKPGHFETSMIHCPTSERCERTSERTSEWPSTYVSILVGSRPQCGGSGAAWAPSPPGAIWCHSASRFYHCHFSSPPFSRLAASASKTASQSDRRSSHFLMRLYISIRGSLLVSVRPLVCPSVPSYTERRIWLFLRVKSH